MTWYRRLGRHVTPMPGNPAAAILARLATNNSIVTSRFRPRVARREIFSVSLRIPAVVQKYLGDKASK